MTLKQWLKQRCAEREFLLGTYTFRAIVSQRNVLYETETYYGPARVNNKIYSKMLKRVAKHMILDNLRYVNGLDPITVSYRYKLAGRKLMEEISISFSPHQLSNVVRIEEELAEEHGNLQITKE